MSDVRTAELVEQWLAGWIVSRRLPAPVRRPYGFVIDIGRPYEIRRHLLTDPDDDTVAAVAAAVTEPMTWLKFPGEPAAVARLFGPVWEQHEEQHMMGVRLARRPGRVPPPGYELVVEPEPDATQVTVRTADGAEAARGRIGLAEVAVVDQVLTDEAHQRRGLGRLVMETLAGVALHHGRTSALLLASDQGRALYETLGWSLITPFTAVSYRS